MAGRAPGTQEARHTLDCATDKQISSLGTCRAPGAGPGATPFPLDCHQVDSRAEELSGWT